ncbi:hypothetical protein N0V93_006783 [Gnomoniopsis smithogilvyi]|uniref:Uncharacterized protein n=1 Tax=Gnomoniopsis smithogilvyi TaxID=1191159 RepID=A0A9W9CW16_9PEZI|nr:hypothetical protein N0V93_006783 [Gnomoniopsis smithogilvyi]
MPSFRGIDISIITQSEFGRLPEYPHPDGSYFQSLATKQAAGQSQPPSSEPGNEDAIANGSANVGDPDARISVYIPSLPGSQFWINYVVENEPSPPCHLFFKLHMNGRHITSWGINPKVKSQGRVEKALYEPCDRWNQEDNGVVFKQEGIEARYFYFVSDQQQVSVADDGGLIEVLVFRAKGRKRRAANLSQYRKMDKYGITAPSGGLVDNPQDVTFFDFHLIDPKDTPFAAFQFHYRSLANLRQLNLIPADDTNTRPSPPTSNAEKIVESISKSSFAILEDDSCIEEQLDHACQGHDETVFDDSTPSIAQSTAPHGEIRPRRNSCYILRTPPQLRPRSATSHYLPQPSKTLRDALPSGFPDSYLARPLPDRPLPEIPTDGPSPNDSYVPRSRKSSTASAAPSVAPSLLSYVKNESYLEETVEYGQGLEIPINKNHPGVPVNENAMSRSTSGTICARISNPLDDTSLTDDSVPSFEGSPSATEDSKKNDSTLISPGNYTPITSSSLENHMCSPSDDEPASSDGPEDGSRAARSPRKKRGDTVDLAIDLSRFPHLQLSESEWIRQTPSPHHVPRRILSPRFGRLWNTLRRSKSRSPLRGIRDKVVSRNYSTPELLSPKAKKNGNWI